MPEVRYARSGDVQVAYQVTGTGSVDLVWAPGTVSHLDLDWEWPPRARFQEALGRFCRLIRFDKRGTGLSDRPTDAATLEERTDDIRAVMEAAGSERAVILGVSEGGSMACVFAAAHPEQTRGLILWGVQARWSRTADYPWGATLEEETQMIELLEREWPSVEYIGGPGAGIGRDVDPAFLGHDRGSDPQPWPEELFGLLRGLDNGLRRQAARGQTGTCPGVRPQGMSAEAPEAVARGAGA